MAPKFNWDDQADAKANEQANVKPSATSAAKFSWDDQKDAISGKTPEPSFGEKLLHGLVAAAETVDSYTGAPVRKGIGAFQDGKGVGEAALEAGAQFGEDPKKAPTGKQIAQKAGVSDSALSSVLPGLYSETGEGMALKRGGFFDPTASAVVGLGVDVLADPTVYLPVGAIAKGAAGGAAKLASKAVNTAADLTTGAGRMASNAGKRVIQGAFGIPEESITRYLARHPQLKDKVGAREIMEELAGKLDEGLKPARAQLEAAEQAVERAKVSRSEDLAELQIRRQEATEALRRAEDSALGEAASRLSGRVNQLDEKVSAGSSKAFEILDKEGVVVPTQQLKSRMTSGIKALEERAVTDEQAAVVDLLKRYRERLDKFGNEIPGGEAKRILQSLDREMRYVAPGEIGRMSKPDQALGALRRHIDEPLKGSKAYASEMAEVSRLMEMLSTTKGLASESAAARALRAAKGAAGKDKADAIRKVAEEFGDDFLALADRRNLPAYHQLKSLLHRVRATKKGTGVKDAETVLDVVRAEVGDAVSLSKNGVAGITDKINATVRQATPSALQTENLNKAGKLAGVHMADELGDIRTIASFERGYNRGSANTNFWGAVIGGVGGSVFGPGGMVGGAAAGGAFGRMVVDNFGPKVGRVILDQAPYLQKLKPTEWIRSLDVPAEVKQKLAQDLAVYQQISNASKGSVAATKPISASEVRRVADSENEPRRTPSQVAPVSQAAPLRGEAKWVEAGAKKLGLDDARMSELMQSKEGRRLLIEASDLPINSKAFQKIKSQLEKGGLTR